MAGQSRWPFTQGTGRGRYYCTYMYIMPIPQRKIKRKHMHLGYYTCNIHKRRCYIPASQKLIRLNITNKNIRMYHPWSSLTDGALNEYIVVGATLIGRTCPVVVVDKSMRGRGRRCDVDIQPITRADFVPAKVFRSRSMNTPAAAAIRPLARPKRLCTRPMSRRPYSSATQPGQDHRTFMLFVA